MSMKKKALAAASYVMVAALAIGGTVAYLTDTDDDINVMTVGNVKIEQHEQERVKDEDGQKTDKLKDFTQNQTLMPVVGDEDKGPVTVGDYTVSIRGNGYKNYVDKIVTVENTGRTDAYVRTIIAVPTVENVTVGDTNASLEWLHWNGVSDSDTKDAAAGGANGWFWGANQTTEWPANNSGWDVVNDVQIGTGLYDLYIATNKNVLAPGKTTAPSLTGFFLDSRVDAEGDIYYYTIGDTKHELGDISDLKILVASQAVQADGFDNAWDALDKAFGDITATNHPWSAIKVSEPVVYTSGEHTISGTVTADTDAVVSRGEGTVVNILDGTYTANGENVCAVWAYEGGTVNIYGGTFTVDALDGEVTSNNHSDAIYAGSKATGTSGTINIYGGTFESPTKGDWLLNEWDDNEGSGITVYGGTFKNFDPSNNAAEGPNTNFVAPGYKVVETVDGEDVWYTVVAAK